MENVNTNVDVEFKKALLSGELASMIKETVKGVELSSPGMIFNIMKPLISQHPDQEKFYIIFLDSKNNILSIDRMFEGSIASCAIYPREVIKKVLYHRARSIILIHNHPSGDIHPSPEDKMITKKIMIACTSIDVIVHDHAIIGNTMHSLANDGVISHFQKEINEMLRD